ncbi:LuxR C-terminal-related transcriptional regulator [Hoyosella sp. YIM 151337]|uniref:helix-turn-helix transcriptional regulator n=1 Tax=Hoyosella sp. YIM 151337 TaxID=2992742 RepID=UPI00223658EF|nr:sigma factor-like helix-turn-helix DNA-binding protein [Hoyosella sp. YIM 151337]MCW4354834.1 LuxR C-terminal-related transcriptional regulator [Hoyosella sp. YIM 151337]
MVAVIHGQGGSEVVAVGGPVVAGKWIGIAGRGDFLDDALAALLRERGYQVVALTPRNGTHRVDLVFFRVVGGGRDADRYRSLVSQAAPVVVLGPRDPDMVSTIPNAVWLQYSMDTNAVVTTVERLIGPADEGPRGPAPQLSAREKDAVVAYAMGMTVREVATELGVAPTTVSTHLDRARAKYIAAGRPADGKIGLLRCALEDGLIPCPCRSRW